MATKLYNKHLTTLMQCKEYYIYDTYIALVHISTEFNNNYIIQTYTDAKSELISNVKKYIPAAYKTISNCLNTLESLNILIYNKELNCWVIKDLEKMHQSGDKEALDEDDFTYSGFVKINEFFFSEDFSRMKLREKRIVIYMAQLSASKNSDKYNGTFKCNLVRPNSAWLKVIGTSSIYYAQYTLNKLLSKYPNIFYDLSESFRSADLSSKRKFKFSFSTNIFKNVNKDVDLQFNLLKTKHEQEYNLIKNWINFHELKTFSKVQIMHLIRTISTLKHWFIKQRVVQIIINKYASIEKYDNSNKIKSLPKYAAAVVVAVKKEFNKFLEQGSNKNLSKSLVGEYYIDSLNNSPSDRIAMTISNALDNFEALYQ